MKNFQNIAKGIIIIVLMVFSLLVSAQFYNGYYQEFGKNRIQYEEFDWTYFKFDRYKVYSYTGGTELATYVSKKAPQIIREIEDELDYGVEESINFIIYNSISDYRQSNIGIDENNEHYAGGVARIVGTKVFLYNEGDRFKLDRQIREGVARIIVNKMTYGASWKEVMKNSALLSLPHWYLEGLVSYIKYQNDPIIENKIKDLVLSGKLEHFNHLEDEEAILAGHIIWKYIHDKYGVKVIPNILYMSRISRSMESGFLYVLGTSLKSLVKNTSNYFKGEYESNEFGKYLPKDGQAIELKKQKNAAFYNFKLSPDGKYISYVSYTKGKYKIWLHDIEQNATNKIASGGFKYGWLVDHSYPIMQWHPSGEMLVFIDEIKTEPMFNTYIIDEGKVNTKPLYKVQKVLSTSFDETGKTMLFSAIQDGNTDIYEYAVRSNSIAQLTFDVFDDLNPSYIEGTDEIIFSSNRINDTLNLENDDIDSDFDLFVFKKNNSVLTRITNTNDVNELNPQKISKNYFSFWANENGISNLYDITFDSTISHIDTTVHYRYITNTKKTTDYTKSLLEYDIADKANKQLELFYFDKNYQLYLKPKAGKNQETLIKVNEKTPQQIVKRKGTNNTTYNIFPNENTESENVINTDNYQFKSLIYNEEERIIEDYKSEKKSTPVDDKFITISKENDQDKNDIIQESFQLPNQRSYYTSFASSDVQTNFDFNFNNSNYQRFGGSADYINPGMGVELKVDLKELFENYKIEAGARFSLNFNYKDYFINLSNKSKRLDKKYTIERQSLQYSITNGILQKTLTNQFKYQLTYPFNEVFSIRAHANIRYDKGIVMATERTTIETPNTSNTLGSFKAELIFDNSTNKGLNLYYGARGKIFAETYNNIFISEGNDYQLAMNSVPDIVILGLDYRKYIKLHREIIWANRLAASTSFGEYKLLYYLGGVDNQIALTSSNNGFDGGVPVPSGNYMFQARATNLRGFSQNSRNGNNFVIINSEVRIPIFRYLSQKPIKSDLIKNFQIVPFTDIGTAWTGTSPYSDENSFKKTYVRDGAITVVLENHKEPIVGSFGLGFRTRLWGYFVKLDYARPIENGMVDKRKLFLSIGYDF